MIPTVNKYIKTVLNSCNVPHFHFVSLLCIHVTVDDLRQRNVFTTGMDVTKLREQIKS